jgi:hypothetical protein
LAYRTKSCFRPTPNGDIIRLVVQLLAAPLNSTCMLYVAGGRRAKVSMLLFD